METRGLPAAKRGLWGLPQGRDPCAEGGFGHSQKLRVALPQEAVTVLSSVGPGHLVRVLSPVMTLTPSYLATEFNSEASRT